MKINGQVYYIFRVLNEEKKLKIFYILALMIDAMVLPLAQVFTSFSEKWLVNAVEFHDSLYMNGVYILSTVIFILIFFVNPLAEYYKEKNVSGMIRSLKDRMTDRLLHFPLEYYTNVDSGKIIVQMTSDIDGVKALFSWSLHRFFLAVFYGFGSVVLMFWLCWQLSIIILILAFFEILGMSKVSVRIQKLSREIQEGKAGGNNLYSAFIKCLKCIKMLSLHDIMYEKFLGVNTEITELQIKRGSHIARMNVVNDFFSAVNLLGVLFAGIILYFGGYVDMGSVMAFLVVQDGVTYMFGNLKDFFATLQQYIINIKRVYEVIDNDLMQKEKDILYRQAIALSEIQCKNVYFKYNQESEYILEDVNIKVSKGDIAAVVGESGNGKSTLVKLIMGFYQPTKGNVFYDDIVNTKITNDEICRLCAYVSQSSYLFYDTIAENIKGGNETATFDMVRNAAALADATDFIMSRDQEFETMVLERGAGYSDGQRQKIAIARAILSNKSVIVFDEATSALDLESEKVICDYLQKEARKRKIIVIVSHRESVNAICNRVFRIENGKVHELSKEQ